MRGDNPIRKPIKGDGQSLGVKSMFATLQGEGPFAGWPAVFLRLGGCNLACDFCDTDFEDYDEMPMEEVLSSLTTLANGIITLIVITGGEPLRQNIVPLCEALLAAGFKIQIETNGTLWRPLPEGVDIVCSPKSKAPLREDLLARTGAIKFIVSKFHPDYSDVTEVGQTKFNVPVYVQPMDEYDEARNAANLAFAAELAHTRGYRLSLQIHKILGIP